MEKRRSEVRQVRLGDFEPISQDVLHMLPIGVIRRQQVIPLKKSDGTLIVATTPKQEGHVKPEGIQLLTKCPVELVLASEEDVQSFIDRYFPEESEKNVLRPVFVTIPEVKPERATPADQVPVTLARVLVDALANRATQVLVEHIGGKIGIRQRIRGVLITDLKAKLTSAELSTVVNFIARIGSRRNDRSIEWIDASVETLVDAETVQCRFVVSSTDDFQILTIHLQKKEEKALTPTALGLGPNQIRYVEKFFARTRGLLIFCGDDNDDVEGTMRSCVRDMATTERHVMAVEMSRQIWFPGVEQLVSGGEPNQFRAHLELAFRHTPDMIVVNPLEKAADAELCMSESLKGRFVLARMYATDSAEAVTRLLAMGIEPYLIGASLIGVVAQRTLRLVCPSCQEKESIPRDRLKELGVPIAMQPSAFFYGKGCPACMKAGFDRESSIFEVLELSDDVRTRLTKDMKPETFRSAIKAAGMMTLRQVAIHKAINGQTSLSEVLRVTNP